jgi:mandelamide amidase
VPAQAHAFLFTLRQFGAANRQSFEVAGGLNGAMKFAVKSNIFVAGEIANAGTPALADARALRSASVVTRVEQAGHQFAGMVGMHELALGTTSNNVAFGPVRNPIDPAHIAGGSSGGSAAAVAAGDVDFALGSDTGGSMRIPAAYCGVVGMRPTTGRYPGDGMYLLSPTRDTAGVFARDVTTVALIDGEITGETELSDIPIESLRLGVPERGFFEHLAPEVVVAMIKTLDALSDAGATLIDVELATLGDGASIVDLAAGAGFPLVAHEAVRHFTEALVDMPDPISGLSFEYIASKVSSPDVKAAVEHMLGEPVTDEQYREALITRERIRDVYRRVLTENQLDALVYPTVGFTAPLIGADTISIGGVDYPVFQASIRNTDPGSLAGQPSMSIPVPVPAGALPVGLGIECAVGDDRRMLAIATAIEKVLN